MFIYVQSIIGVFVFVGVVDYPAGVTFDSIGIVDASAGVAIVVVVVVGIATAVVVAADGDTAVCFVLLFKLSFVVFNMTTTNVVKFYCWCCGTITSSNIASPLQI